MKPESERCNMCKDEDTIKCETCEYNGKPKEVDDATMDE